jgi:hypothetical protein
MLRSLENERSRRQVLGFIGSSAAAGVASIRLSFAQGSPQSGQVLPPLLLESYPDQMTSKPRVSMPESLPSWGFRRITSQLLSDRFSGRCMAERTL